MIIFDAGYLNRPIAPLIRRVNQNLVKLWKDSVRAFILATLDHMSIDTGMSVASLQPLAAKVSFRSALLEQMRGFGPKTGHQNIKDSRFLDNIGKYKSASLGKRLGSSDKAYELTFGTDKNPIFTFRFSIVVFQHYLHEEARGVSGGAWKSVAAGQEAFLKHFDAHVNRVIEPGYIARYLITGNL